MSSTITIGTRISFDGGLWEVAEMTAAGVVLRDAPARRPGSGYPPQP